MEVDGLVDGLDEGVDGLTDDGSVGSVFGVLSGCETSFAFAVGFAVARVTDPVFSFIVRSGG
jgi:hypothetical protein